MSEDEARDRHTLSCAVWQTNNDCDCGAEEFPLLTPEPGTLPDRLNHIGEAS